MSQFINNPEHTFGFDTLQLHVGQESADPALVLPTPVTSTAV